MFGYIKPESRELKVKEYELYKSAYCGLCRVMGKRYSYLYKMSLSYDFVFMVLLRLYAIPDVVSFSKKRCIAHPLKKKVMMDSNSALETASDIGVIMLYHDFLDKIRDKDGIKSFICKIMMPEIRALRKKACKNDTVKAFDCIVEEKLFELSDLEKENTKSIDSVAECFGSILAEALSLGYDGNLRTVTYEVGRNIGKWIYIIDALDDIDTDEKLGNYNPFISSFGDAKEAKKNGSMIKTALLNILSSADKAFEVLDKTDDGVYNILTNIIRLGNVETVDKVLKKNGFVLTEG